MPERKKMNIPGLGAVEGTDVALVESVERWTELKLEDGSVLRIKPIVMSVMRIEGQYDPQDNPMYAIQAGQTMVVASAPEHLRRPGPNASKVH
jgi:hypothetical protein